MLADKPTHMQQGIGRVGAVQCSVTETPEQDYAEFPKVEQYMLAEKTLGRLTCRRL